MSVYLPERITGLPGYVGFDGDNFSHIDDIPDDWLIDLNARKSIKNLAELSCLKFDDLPDERFIKASQDIFGDLSHVRWRDVMPKSQHTKYVKRLFDDALDVINRGCVDYHDDIFLPVRDFLTSLERARIDIFKFNKVRHECDDDISSLNYDEDGYCENIVYDQLSSKTGRLKVTSGPRILTLKREHRNMFRSRYENGSIIIIDYVSLEPRIALTLAGKIPDDDVYQMISRDILKGEFDRDTTKSMTVSIMYGSGWRTIMDIAKIDRKKAQSVRKKISSFFDIDRISKGLKNSASEKGSIENHFGRRLKCEELSMNVLYNMLMQSSASDAALIGFSNLTREMREINEPFHPLFVIHDALMVDVHNSILHNIDKFKEMCETIDGLDTNLLTKVEIVR